MPMVPVKGANSGQKTHLRRNQSEYALHVVCWFRHGGVLLDHELSVLSQRSDGAMIEVQQFKEVGAIQQLGTMLNSSGLCLTTEHAVQTEKRMSLVHCSGEAPGAKGYRIDMPSISTISPSSAHIMHVATQKQNS